MSGVFRTFRTPSKASANPIFRWTYWLEYTASEPAFRTITEGSELDALKVRTVYRKREQKGLWWWANCATGLSSKGAIRHHFTKLLRKGFEDALKEKGYERDGSRSVQDGVKDLTGSLQMLGHAKITDPNWDNVQKSCASMLDTIIKLQNSPHVEPRRKQVPFQKHDQGRRPTFKKVDLS